MPLVRPAERLGQAIDCSIIIPAFNCQRFTQACVETLIRDRSRASFEIIVVDNGSSDGTAEYLAARAGYITILSPGVNLGFAKANNLAVKTAVGRYLVLLNNDTVPEPGWLDAMVETAASEDRIAVVGAKLLYPVDRTVQHAGVVITNDLKLKHLYEGLPEQHPAVNKRRDFRSVTGACMLVRSDVYRRFGGLDEGFVNGFEDVDFCWRVSEAGLRVVYEPAAVVLHHAERTQGRHDNETANAVRLTRRWRGKLQPDIDRYLNLDGFNKDITGTNETVPKGEEMIKLLDSARETLKEGRIDEALKQYEKINSNDPDNATALSYRADLHDRRGELEKATTLLVRLLRVRGDAEVSLKLAQNALKRKQYDNARKYALEALKLPSIANGCIEEARTIIADATYKSGAVDAAVELYDEVLTVAPDHVRALTGRGTTALTKKDYTKANQCFDHALVVNPHHTRALLGKGLAFLGLGRRREAANLIAEALLIEPDNGWAIATILPVLSESGKLDLADEILKRYLERYPDDHPMLLARSGVNYALGRTEISRQLLDKVLETHPDYPGAQDLDMELRRMAEVRIDVVETAVA
jgi:GT2 family glycosyltransferase/Tfp pilus assembly protein PilF